MCSLLRGDIDRLILRYIIEQNYNDAADSLCKNSPFLKEELNILRQGIEPTYLSTFDLTAILKEYVELKQKSFNQITIQLDQLRRLQKQNSSVANTQENEILNDQGIDTRHVNNDSEEFGENSGSIQEHSRAKATGNQNYTEYIDENDVGNQTYCSELSTIEEIENENEYENDFEANNLLSSLSNIKSTLIKQMMNEQVKEAKGRKELKQSKNSNQSDDSLNKPLLTITPAKVMLKRLNDNIVQQFEHDNHDTNKNIEIKSKKFKKKN